MIGSGTLKAASAAGTLVVCGLSGLVVATGTKPAAAPLRPPVPGAAPPAATTGLIIPPSCGTPPAPAGPPLQITAVLQPIYAQLRQAKSAAERAAILAPLPPDQRQQLTAYARQQQRRAGRGAGGSPCAASGGGASSGDLVPSISDAPASTGPVVDSYVS